MKQEKIKYDFKALSQAIKEAQKVKGLSRNELVDQMNIVLEISHPLKIVDSTQDCKSFMNLLLF